MHTNVILHAMAEQFAVIGALAAVSASTLIVVAKAGHATFVELEPEGFFACYHPATLELLARVDLSDPTAYDTVRAIVC